MYTINLFSKVGLFSDLLFPLQFFAFDKTGKSCWTQPVPVRLLSTRKPRAQLMIIL